MFILYNMKHTFVNVLINHSKIKYKKDKKINIQIIAPTTSTTSTF